MAAQNALIGVAVGAYYPDLSLSAVGGYAADPIGGLFSVSNALWSLGTNATETLFAGGTRSAAVAAAEFSYDQAVAAYRQTVLTAFQDVEDDLSNLRILAAQAEQEDAAVADASQAAQIALNEYEAGTQAYTAVVSAQLTLLADQQTALAVRQKPAAGERGADPGHRRRVYIGGSARRRRAAAGVAVCTLRCCRFSLWSVTQKCRIEVVRRFSFWLLRAFLRSIAASTLPNN